jgi:hypothetical protein
VGDKHDNMTETGSTPVLPIRSVMAMVLVAVAATVMVGFFVTPTGFARPSMAPVSQQYLFEEPGLQISGYAFNDDVKQVTVTGASTLPDGAVVVVELRPFGAAAGNDSGFERATGRVNRNGHFEAKLPFSQFGDAPVLQARAAFDPRWDPNVAFRIAYGSAGEKLWGPKVISDGNAQQLYDEHLLFRAPIFSSNA